MKKVEVTINVAKDGFLTAYCNDIPSLIGGGETPDEAISELRETLRLNKDEGKDSALLYPEWLDEPYELAPSWDVESFLRYFGGIITPTALSKLSGIHPKQLWSYMHGRSKPRKAQVIKIENALHQLGRQLVSIYF